MRLLGSDICTQFPAVTKPVLYLKTGEPHPEGLFSYEIFGYTTKERSERFGSIYLNTEVFHPHVWILIRKTFRKQIKAILNMLPYTITEDGDIIIYESQEDAKDKDDVNYGLPFFIDNFESIKIPDTISGKALKQIMDEYGQNIKISCIPVIPPVYREIFDVNNLDPLNEAYISLIKYSYAISEIEDKTYNNIQYAKYVNMIQLKIETIYDVIESKTAKKTGAIRSLLLGKRLDFTGRSVIIVDPELDIDELGVPIRMAVKLFEPWLLRKLTIEYGMKVDVALDMITKIALGYINKSSEEYNQVVESLEEIVKDRVVLAKRDPALHRLSWQAFKIKLVEDNAIHVNPTVTVPFNADFDGDTFALFVPLTKEGIEEARKLMNPYHPAYPRRLKYELNKDYKYAFCILTSNPPDDQSLVNKYWWWKDDKLKFQNQTYIITKGRKKLFDIVAEIEPDYENKLDQEFVNKLLQPKIDFDDLTIYLLEKIGVENTKSFINEVKNVCNEIMFLFTQSINIADLKMSDSVQDLVNQLDENKPLEENQKILDEISKRLKEIILNSDTGLKYLIKCGVAKFNQTVQLLGAKGLVLSPDGSVKLIKSNFAKGLKPTEYFEAGHGARMGIVSRAQKTAITGYLQRQLVYASASVELDPNLDDCGTGKTIKLYVDEDIAKRIINRYIYQDGRLIKITTSNYKDLIDQTIELRTPLYCISKKICKTCYGDDYKYINSTKVGFVAAEAIGERFTQEMLKAFHTGGVVKFDFPNPIVESANLLVEDRKIYEDLLEYDADKKVLKAKKELDIILDKEFYNLNAFVSGVNTDEKLELETFICDIRHGDNTVPFSYNNSVLLFVPNDITKDKEEYILSYKAGDEIIEVLPVTSDIEAKAKSVLTILNGKGQFKSIENLLNMVLSKVKGFGMFNLVHLEILLSQILRCPDNIKYPYRLCKDFSKEPVLIGIKKVPYVESWKRALEFENFKNAVTNAILDPEVAQESLLDELI